MTRILLLAVLALGCAHTPPAVPPGTPTCATSCARLEALGCAEARPTPKGVSCVEVCQNATSVFALDLRCMTDATDCGAARKCGQ